MRLFKLFLVILFLVASVDLSYSSDEIINVNGEMAGLYSDPFNGDPYIFFYESYNVFVVKNMKNGVFRKFEIKGSTARGADLLFLENELFVLWQGKDGAGHKYVYMERLNKKNFECIEQKKINSEKDVLLPVKSFYIKNRLYVTWMDERKQSYNIWMNFTDENLIFTQNDRNFYDNAHIMSAELIEHDSNLYIFSSGCFKDETPAKCGLMFQKTDFDIKQLLNPQIIQETGVNIPLKLFSFDNHPFPLVIWVDSKGIHCSYLENSEWKTVDIPETSQKNITRISVKKDKNHSLYLVASYADSDNTKKEKENVYFYKSSDAGKSWTNPVVLRHYPYKSTSASGPDIHITEKGNIVVVWQDHRLIRGNIFMNYSKDGGNTWQNEDINLSEPPGANIDIYPFIDGNKENIYVMWHQSFGDKIGGDTKIKFKEVNLK